MSRRLLGKQAIHLVDRLDAPRTLCGKDSKTNKDRITISYGMVTCRGCIKAYSKRLESNKNVI